MAKLQVTYKAGWSQQYVLLGVYDTRAEAVAAKIEPLA
jgi:hypothetical protein